MATSVAPGEVLQSKYRVEALVDGARDAFAAIAVEGGGLYLNYGACEEGEAAAVAIGHRIVAALEDQGLATDWDGRLEQRIGVALVWKKRRSVRVLES